MAYRTSKPLHPTEFDPIYETKKKSRTRKKGGYKSATLDKTVVESLPSGNVSSRRTTTSITKTKGKGGKKPTQKKQYISKIEKGIKTPSVKDDSTTYQYTKVRKNKVKRKKSGKDKVKIRKPKVKEITKKQYERKKKRMEKKYDRFRGTES